jgi:MoxR-like ATPase
MMIMSIDLKYTGENQGFGSTNEAIDDRQRLYRPYIATDELIEAVNIAIDLGRPLLIEGLPGCGKTELAAAIAYEFTQKYREHLRPGQEWWPWDTWNIKSTEQASDGLYSFDAISQLRDAQLAGVLGTIEFPKKDDLLGRLQYNEAEELEKAEKDRQEHPYIRIGKFGQYLQKSYAPLRPILLIDEIDKADADFPNDLLMELEKSKFEIKETGKTYSGNSDKTTKPIVIITSNRERPLSDAFLRRCIYFSLDFPNETVLRQITASRFPELPKKSPLVTEILAVLADIQKVLDEEPGAKLPGTSEMLDLVDYLQHQPQALDKLKEIAKKSPKSPLLGILLKTKQDQERYQNARGG